VVSVRRNPWRPCGREALSNALLIDADARWLERAAGEHHFNGGPRSSVCGQNADRREQQYGS
jgi:hypothetical protein